MANTLQIGAIAVTGLVLLFCIISTSTNYWFQLEAGKIEFHSGLWESCISSKCQTVKPRDGSTRDKLSTVRAFAILAILAFALMLISLALTFLKKIRVVLALFIAPFGTMCQLIAMSVYTEMSYNTIKLDRFEYGYLFILGWIALPMALTSFGLTFAIRFYENRDESNFSRM